MSMIDSQSNNTSLVPFFFVTFVALLRILNETQASPLPEDCLKKRQLPLNKCYAQSANLSYDNEKIYFGGFGSFQTLKCRSRQSSFEISSEDEFNWFKDGKSLQTSGSCFNATSNRWPAEIKCASYNYHTSDGIYFCVNQRTGTVVSEFTTDTYAIRQPWLHNEGFDNKNCKPRYELNVFNISEKMTFSCGMVYSTMTHGNQLVTWWSIPDGTTAHEKRSKAGGINATLTIDTSASANSSKRDGIFGQYTLYAANTHPSQSIREIFELNKQIMLMNISLIASEKTLFAPSASKTAKGNYFLTNLSTFLIIYLIVMTLLAGALITSRKIKIRRQSNMLQHDLRNVNGDSQRFPVNFEMNTVSTYASGGILATASSSTAILTTNYDQYLLGAYSGNLGLCYEDKSLQVQEIYSNPTLANYLIPESCLNWKNALNLGSGHFATVFRLKTNDENQDHINCSHITLPKYVAMKQLRNPTNSSDYEKFYQEILIMTAISERPHVNLMKILGVCVRANDDITAITEFCEYGNVRDYLRGKRKSRRNDQSRRLKYNWKLRPKLLNRVVKFAEQIAQGMHHLEKHQFVHRDLALRNVFLAKEDGASTCNKVVKIGDYGLTKDVFDSDGQYSKMSEGDMPIKWMAPESLNAIATSRNASITNGYKLCGIFTSKSDAWSYGIVLWELITLGGTPYPNLHYSEVVNRIIEGYRMDRPRMCPKLLHDIMSQCWQHEADDRPSFENILSQLDGSRA